MVYDALNRPVRTTYHDGSKVIYTWDVGINGLGRLGKIDEYAPGGNLVLSLTRTYTPEGRLQSEIRSIANIAYTITYSYSGGQLSGLTLLSARLGFSNNT